MGNRPRKARTKSLHDRDYAAFVKLLVAERNGADLTQQVVADRLGWNQSQVSKIETLQRRIDVVEFVQLASAVGFDPVFVIGRVCSEMRLRK